MWTRSSHSSDRHLSGMAGVLFVVCVPNSGYEKKLRKTDKSPEKTVAFNFNLTKSISDDDLSKRKAKSRENVVNEEARSLLDETPTPTPTSPTFQWHFTRDFKQRLDAIPRRYPPQTLCVSSLIFHLYSSSTSAASHLYYQRAPTFQKRRRRRRR